jgi:hypothetical protein
MNVRFDRPNDPMTERLIQVLSAVDAVQCVDQPTHVQDGTLDVVIPHKDSQPSAVEVIDVGDEYDHWLLSWSFHISPSQTPIYRTQQRRSWKSFNAGQFRADLQVSSLCTETGDSSQVNVDTLVSEYDDVITRLLDVHAPYTETTCRVRRRSDPRYDLECRSTKSQTKTLKRRYRRWHSDYARSRWTSLRSLHRLV